MRALILMSVIFLLPAAAMAADVPVAGGKVSVTQPQCQALATYHTPPGVDYQPGVDVHGKPVVPADLPDSNNYQAPAKIEFDVRINPLTYGQSATQQSSQSATQASVYNNTSVPVGHVVVDTKTGAVTLNGNPIGDAQEAALTDLCRKAGY